MRLVLTIVYFILFYIHPGFCSNTVNIAIFREIKLSYIAIGIVEGTYELQNGNDVIHTIDKSETLHIIAEHKHVLVKSGNKTLGKFPSVKLVRKTWKSSFRVKPMSPPLAERTYHDHLTINLAEGRDKYLQVINNVYVENYVSGVVEAESGSKQSLEYYKVQAIICRTYALGNYKRHRDEGFHLCDQVHCQVYRGVSRFNPDVIAATELTNGLVIVDSDINLITAAFHSNCGGQTANAENVWKYALPYLRSVCDTFCSSQPHAYWGKKIPRSNWLGYFNRKYSFPVNDSLFMYSVTNYIPDERDVFITRYDTNITLTGIRSDWQLNSAWFNVLSVPDTVILRGNGYGHGVGLCQEGAMAMSNSGYLFNEILHYYYTCVHIIDLSLMDFFKE